jgi:16S rRNA (cytosine1402-N4)-methyltransferase
MNHTVPSTKLRTSHIPVLLKEVITFLNPKEGEIFLDGTFGGGGHSRAIYEKIGSKGRLLCFDMNPGAINLCSHLLPHKNVACVESNFKDILDVLKKFHIKGLDGLLLDLGLSSDELENSGRGFTFQKDEPLLMTMSDKLTPLKDLLKYLNEEEIADVIFYYGEERYSRRIAKSIYDAIKNNEMNTTSDLSRAILKALPLSAKSGRIHAATKTFMAFRIFANHEVENLNSVLSLLPNIMNPGGRVSIISFHSIEDRLVKNAFRELAHQGKATLLTKKALMGDREELLLNPRSRSAKLRAIKFTHSESAKSI